MFCMNCGAELTNGAAFCSNCGARTAVHFAPPVYEATPIEPEMSMDWHKLLTNVGIYILAFLNIGAALLNFIGINHVCAYPFFLNINHLGSRTLDIVYALLLIALAGYGIYVRSRLAGFKADAPKLLTFFFIGELIAGGVLIASFCVGLVSNVNSGSSYFDVFFSLGFAFSYVIPYLIWIIAATLLNSSYYKKRKSLFIN